MRLEHLTLLVSMSVFTSGCSSLIAGSGKDLTGLTTREEVYKELGQPSATGVIKGHEYDEYRTHRKLAEPDRSSLLGLRFGFSFGLSEAIEFPIELLRLSTRSLFGQTLRFTYNENGRIIGIFINGKNIDDGTFPQGLGGVNEFRNAYESNEIASHE